MGPSTADASWPGRFAPAGLDVCSPSRADICSRSTTAARPRGSRSIDTRHEASAAWAAEGYAKATREPGVCALTAGPGVTNGMSPIAGAQQNRSPLVVLGGRAPEMRWGSGSLQEIDHLPFVEPLVKSAVTVKETAADPGS